MSPYKILIASVLKPLKDARTYYRFTYSLRETNKYQINIIGFSSKKEPDEENIRFYPIFNYKRNLFSRWLTGLTVIAQIKKVKPGIIIISTWELLPAAIIGKIIFGGKLVYDVQENTFANIQFNRTMADWKKPFAKGVVAVSESLAKPFIDCYFFAEQCYIHELPKFKPYVVLENKFYGQLASRRKPIQLNSEKIKFLISGTITEVYGILDAVEWFKVILKIRPNSQLTIIGHCPLQGFKKKIIEACDVIPAITLNLSEHPVPYGKILESYHQADVVLMPYHQIPSIKDKIPSKLYESLALGKPCLFSPNPVWRSITEKYRAGMEMKFKDLEHVTKNFENFLKETFYTTLPGDELLWKSEEGKFLEIMEKLRVDVRGKNVE
ncbi:glycosyltransferase [Shivajiella indica]|uniref:Glycosyltransferase n=1 Tax=Shivajiella indica TaxID=872115 RepID=A0ABW5B6I2_9BACT